MSIFDSDPVITEVQRVLNQLERGIHDAGQLESRLVDPKEEAGGRG